MTTGCSTSEFWEDCVLTMRARIVCVALLVVGSLWLAGCPERTSIERINQDPGRFAGKEVSVVGRVTNSFGAMGTGVFEIEDGTGRLWVFSGRYGIPGREARLAVTGRIEQGFSFGGRNFATILRETERRH
jgi:hypothetical protein